MNMAEFKKTIENMDIFEIYDWIENLESEEIENLDGEEADRIVEDKITENMDELLIDPRLFADKYDYIRSIIIEKGDIKIIVKLLKENIKIDEILGSKDISYDLSDIEELDESDKQVFIEKLGRYLPIDVQEKLMPGINREELLEVKRHSIKDIKEAGGSRTVSQLKGMTEDEIVKIANELSGDDIKKILVGLSEETKVQVLGIAIGRGSLANYEIAEIVEDLSEENKLKTIEIGLEKLDGYKIVEIAEGLSEENKLKAIEIGLEKLDGYDIAKIAKGLNEGNKLKAIEIGLEKLDGYKIVEIAEGLSEENKLKAIEVGLEKLYDGDIFKIAEGLSEENKLKAIEVGFEKLDGSNIVKMTEGLSEEDKLKAIEIGFEKLDGSNIVKMTEGLSEENKLKVIEMGLEKLDGYNIVKMTKDLSEENKLKVIEVGFEKLKGYGLVEIANDLSEENKLEVIRLEMLNGSNIVEIAWNLSEENKLKAIEIGLEKLDGYCIAEISKGLNEENKLKAIEVGFEKLVGYSIVEIAKGLNEENKLKAIEIGLEKLDGVNIVEIAKGMNEENKMEVIYKYEHLLSDNNLGEILSSFSDTLTPEIEKCFKGYLENKGFKAEKPELSFEIFRKLGPRVIIPQNAIFASEKSIEVIGKEDIYDLFKYYLFTGEEIEIDNILENPELFAKYEEYRKGFMPSKQMHIMNKKDAICEFNGNGELIKDCMEYGELNSQEAKMLKGAVKEEKIKIRSKEELKDFPQKRKELIEQMIQEGNFNEALTFLFTGMSTDEYDKKVYQYLNDESLSNMVQDVDGVDTELAMIKATNELIELIGQMDTESQRKVLKIYNDDLANEFEEKGSAVATQRSAYEDIEVKIRKVYGKELSASLKQDKMPEAQTDEIDNEVKVINLKDEKFKMLIHGIDAYGSGSGKFEKREVGKSYICTSLISQDYTGHASARRYYGFSNVGENALVEEKNCDMNSVAKSTNSLEVTSRRGSTFLTSDRMIEETGRGYNEVVLWREYMEDDGERKEITPDYIVCFGEINDGDREEAKRLNLPIVLLDDRDRRGKNIKLEESKVDMPKEYEDTKIKAMDVLKDAGNKCSARLEQEAIQKMVAEIEKQLSAEKDIIH